VSDIHFGDAGQAFRTNHAHFERFAVFEITNQRDHGAEREVDARCACPARNSFSHRRFENLEMPGQRVERRVRKNIQHRFCRNVYVCVSLRSIRTKRMPKYANGQAENGEACNISALGTP
jgi:hypothetical protein